MMMLSSKACDRGRVRGFPNHLIYYVPVPDGIDVLAIMHGARDVQRHLLKRVQ